MLTDHAGDAAGQRSRRAVTSYGDLARRIRLGEDSALELKQVSVKGSRVAAPRRNDVADELGAFANGRGGELVLGVDDATRTVTGIPLDALDVVEPGSVRSATTR